MLRPTGRTILVSNEGEPSGYGSPEYVDPEVRCAAPCCAALHCAMLGTAGCKQVQQDMHGACIILPTSILLI